MVKDVSIFVLQRGWVVVGEIVNRGHIVEIAPRSKTIRKWGTTKGLGELASGPLTKTVLDDLPFGSRFNELTVVFEIPCNAAAWVPVLK